MSVFTTTAVVGLRHRLSCHSYSCIRNLSSPTNENIGLVEVEDDNTMVEKDAAIDKILNKSRLRPEHRNLLFEQRPYSEPITQAHCTVTYNRKLYGKYGSASGVNPGIMWPTKSELVERNEYEKVAYPYTINEMINLATKEIKEKENEKLMVEKRIVENMAKLDMWKKQLRDTIAKKEADALAAKEKKQKLLEEVRRHFGFNVDPREERFKEMLAVKEKEMKKKEKQAKMEEKERKAIARLMETHKSDI